MKSFKKWMVVPYEEEKESELIIENKKQLEINNILGTNKLNDEEKLIKYNKQIRNKPIKKEPKEHEQALLAVESQLEELKKNTKNTKALENLQNQIDKVKLNTSGQLSSLKSNLDSNKKTTRDEFNNMSRKVNFIDQKYANNLYVGEDEYESDLNKDSDLDSTNLRKPFQGTREKKRRRKERVEKNYKNVTQRKNITDALTNLSISNLPQNNLSTNKGLRWEHNDNDMSFA